MGDGDFYSKFQTARIMALLRASPADINECAEGSHACHGNATCSNTVGSFSCECQAGTVGNGFKCEGEEKTFFVYCSILVSNTPREYR